MPNSTILLKEMGGQGYKNAQSNDYVEAPEIKEFYKEHLEIGPQYNGNKMYYLIINYTLDKRVTYYVWKSTFGSYFYNWPGIHSIMFDHMPPFEKLDELFKIKYSELERAQIKRSKEIKKPIDAVKQILAEKWKVYRIQGGVRIDFNFGTNYYDFISAFACMDEKDGQLVHVSVRYHSMNSYLKDINLGDISLSDPKFEEKINYYIENIGNVIKFLRGDIQNKLRVDHPAFKG
jgi:hypothetical protein